MSYKDPIDLTKDRAMVERFNNVIGVCGHLTYFPLVVDKYEGSIITDIDGNKYIDFLSSASSMNLGGGHPAVLAATREQIEKVTQYATVYTYNVPQIEYAERLTSVYPGGADAKVAFGHCGSDSNDAAIKFARAYTGKTKIITFVNSYHGNTYASSSLTTVTNRMRHSIGPMLPEIYSFPFSDCFHCMFDKCPDNCDAECIRPLERAQETYVEPDETAAVIIEVIQGDGGIIAANERFIKKLYDICKANDILFIVEEVQQGLGRTGKWFSIENYDIVPDGIILGKSVGAGFPLGVFMARREIIDSLGAPAHGFTFAGNHVSCAAGSAAFDVINEPGFLDEVNRKGEYIKEGFAKLRDKYGLIGDIRGWGMSIGVEIVNSDGTPDVTGTSKMCYRAFEKGLVMISLAGNVFRVQPPLVITYDEIDRALAIIDETIDEYINGKIPDEVLENCAGW